MVNNHANDELSEVSVRRAAKPSPAASFQAAYLYCRPFVRAKAAALVYTLGLPPADREDLEQDLWLDQWIRLRRHDPRRSSARTFANRLITNRAASIVEQQRAQRRDVRRCRRSLNDVVETDEGRVELAETISHSDYLQRWGRPNPTGALDLHVDLARFQARLPEELACLMDHTMFGGSAEICSREGYSRATYYRRRQQLRQRLARHGLDAYLTRGTEAARG